MSPYWMNNTCSPFLGPASPCTLGNLASFAINVSNAEDAIAGVRFAQDNNLRLTIKNTGHDFLGRSAGAGSLALWTHNLKDIAFINYTSPLYSGPAARVGAGAEYADIYQTASAQGYRVVGGSCPTVGVTGGFTQGGGHGPLGGAYGLAADQVLEWEVVTAAGQHLAASPAAHPELYWALSGGGPGNYAAVLSMTVRAYADGPVAGAGFTVASAGNGTAFWTGVAAWLERLLVLDAVDGLTTVWALTSDALLLEFATLPGVNTTSELDGAIAPFLDVVADLDVSLVSNYTSSVHDTFAEHYEYWVTQTYGSNTSLGGRLIPRATVQDTDAALPCLVNALRNITGGGGKMLAVAANTADGNYTPNAVLPAWRDALFTMSFAKPLAEGAIWDVIRSDQAQLNAWQDELRSVTPGGGTYMNEATWDNQHWKVDYFGSNYDELLRVKETYDPDRLFWAAAAIGSDDHWELAGDGRLCRV